MKVHQILGITLATAVSILALPKEANADQISNGASLNGITLNGISMNGTSFNGTNLNGLQLNGTSTNGVVLNGANLNGVSMNGTSQGTKPDARTGLTLSSSNFAGIKVEGGRLVGVK